MKDGFHFQFVFACGVFIVSLLCLLLFPFHDTDFEINLKLYPKGCFAGVFWCIGNAMTVAIVSKVGLGVGMSVWSGTTVIFSFLIGRFALFGLDSEISTYPSIGLFGIILGVFGLVCFSRLYVFSLYFLIVFLENLTIRLQLKSLLKYQNLLL